MSFYLFLYLYIYIYLIERQKRKNKKYRGEIAPVKPKNDKFKIPNINDPNNNNSIQKSSSSDNPIENNTINLSLKSDKFVVIPSDNNIVTPNMSFNNVYPSKDDVMSDKLKLFNSMDILNDTFVNNYTDKNGNSANPRYDIFTKKQLKLAERNYERKINMMRHQEKLYNDELARKQLEKKSMNVNFQINEIQG